MATNSQETRSSRPSPLQNHPSLDPKAPSEAALKAAGRQTARGRSVGTVIVYAVLAVVCASASWLGCTAFAGVQKFAIASQTADMKSLRTEIMNDIRASDIKSQDLERKLIAENTASRTAAASSFIAEPVRSAPESTFVASNR